MKKLLLSFIAISVSFIGFNQYCVTGGPTSTIDSNVESVTLTGASGAINYIGCPGLVGLQEDLTQTTTLNASGIYTASIQFGTCGNNFSGVGEAWIDYNQNMIFEASESIGTWTGTPPVAISNFLFVVPAGATNGATRMRVVQAENAILPLDPCATFNWGSMVDFTIVITGGSGSSGPCEGGPAATGDSNVESVILNGTSGTAINYTGCPGILGVEQSTETVTLGVGNNFQADIQFGTCGGNYPGNGEAWIDFNQNSIFEPSESIGTWTGTPPTSMSTFLFNVPLTALLGSTKMRVQQQESSTLPLDPCVAFTWGSVVDFNVVIEPGFDCTGYVGDDETDPRLATTFPYTENHNNSICYSNQNPVYSSPDVYYLVIPSPTASNIEVSLCGSSFDTFLSVYDTDGNVLSINDDHADCGIQSKLTVSVANHDSVYVIVEGWGNGVGDYIININEEYLDLNSLEKDKVSIYPNPTKNNFTINNYSGDIQIMNSEGRIVFENTIFNGETIDVSSFNKGFYFVNFIGEHQSFTKKLIIQ